MAEAVAWRYSTKKVFLKILQNLQENICEGINKVPAWWPATLLKQKL